MRIPAAALVVILSLPVALATVPARAFTEEELSQPFDPSRLRYEEKRFLQASLAFLGDYNGLIDGAWGSGSERALARYAAREWPGMGSMNLAAAGAALEGWLIMSEGGWEETWFETLGISMLIPSGMVNESEEGTFRFRHPQSSLTLILDRGDGFAAWHVAALENARPGTEPYTLRRDQVNITSVQGGSGMTIYLRSDWLPGTWTTVGIFAQPADAALLAAVSGSIRKGNAGKIHLPAGGVLETGIRTALDASSPAPALAPDAAHPPPAGAEEGRASGTGFLVSGDGKVLTNHHVVEHCTEITAGGQEARLFAADAGFDLAVLDVPSLAGRPFASFAPAPARLNSDVTVVGYPLHGLLSGLNVTRGSLTSLKGLAGSSTTMQVSAPVQPGNSGGPVLNARGAVIGVVVSKLDAGLVQGAIGDIPQNVNFAIRGEIARVFLASNGIQPEIAPEPASDTAPEDLAEKAAAFTYLIECD